MLIRGAPMRRSPVVTVVFMPLATGLLLGALAATLPARAQHASPDGFSICSFANSGGKLMQSSLGACQTLTDQAMRSFGLSASQAAIVATLQSFTANPNFDLPPRVVNASLASPKQFAAVGAFTDYWYPDVTDPANVELGVHLIYVKEDAKPRLFAMTYAVDGVEGHFSVLWNRALASPRK
jgi:hypothetical protein